MYPINHLSYLVVVGLGLLQVKGTSSFSLSISPDQVDIAVDPVNVTITCTADEPLTDCQFSWLDLVMRGAQKNPRPLLKLSQGPESKPDSSHLNTGVTGYGYSGRGLREGDCGVTLELKDSKEWMVGCRVRTAHGGWKYAWINLHAWVRNSLPVTVSQREVVVLPGGEATLMCRSPRPLESCRFFLPGSEQSQVTFDLGAKSLDSTRRFLYHGEGLERGECGIRIKNVSEHDNEPVQCYLSGSEENQMKAIPVTVASPPSPPVLDVAYEGTLLKATCSAGPSRPPANITWLLDDIVLRQDQADDSPVNPEAPWGWPWVEASTSQNLVYKLENHDVGRRLRCVTSHPALPQPLETATVISF